MQAKDAKNIFGPKKVRMMIFFVHFYANDVSIHGALGLTHDQRSEDRQRGKRSHVLCSEDLTLKVSKNRNDLMKTLFIQKYIPTEFF